jgi:hypothetical protein
MSGESEWVSQKLVPWMNTALVPQFDGHTRIQVAAAARLCYAHEVSEYSKDGNTKSRSRCYQTDLLITEHDSDGRWTPRVIVECKLGKVTTHDALTYSSKAATHKHVHPYLRYGILIGGLGTTSLPPRLVRHGAHFDFMMVWHASSPSEAESAAILRILQDEVIGSRRLQSILMPASGAKAKVSTFHRPVHVTS